MGASTASDRPVEVSVVGILYWYTMVFNLCEMK